MESGIQSSFIPHDTARTATGAPVRTGSFVDLVALLALVLFVASVVAGVGVFLYLQFLQTSGQSKVDQLERAKAAFEPSLILELTRLDDRMRDADVILGNHIAPSVFFHTLEQETLSTIAFRTLDFEATDAQSMTIKMDGVAQSVNSIALQADLFSKNRVITSPIFSNIDRQQDGVHFSLTAVVNPASVRYTQLVTSGASTQTAAAGAAILAPGAAGVARSAPTSQQQLQPQPTQQ